MALPKLLQKLFQNNGAGDKLNPSIIPTKVNGAAADATGNITVNANPPSISVSATTLAAGSSATVTKSGTDAAPSFVFGIPKGDKGDKGDKGETGALGTISGGAAILYSKDVLVTTGSGNITEYYPAVQRDSYGRVIKVGRAAIKGNCNCNCDCDCDCSGSD